MPLDWYIRFARHSPGIPFTFQNAWKVMKKFDVRYLDLTAVAMEPHLLQHKMAFEVPGLKTKEGYDVLYFRPSRYSPKDMPLSILMDNLCYSMQCMLERENNQDGIGFIANMAGWKMTNFSLAYWHKLMMLLQGRKVPTRVERFLILDPPSWFGSIWSITKPMLTEAFRRNVHIITFHDLGKYLQAGYHHYMPDDVYFGKADTNRIIQNFIAYRKRIESAGVHSL